MKWLLAIGIILSSSTTDSHDDISIIWEDEPVAEVHRTDFSIPWFGFPILNHTLLDTLNKQLSNQIKKEPKNAGLDDYGNIIPEKVGYILDEKKFKERFAESFFDHGPTRILVPTLSVYPKVDSEIISNIRTKLIGHYITYFNSANKERTHNISLAAEAINNHVVFPGEIFSFNKVVGKRTASRGYQPAPIIVRGELSEGIGGGICQVSSTLFNAADRSGLKILERYSHSKQVPYVPPGRDATVSWYGPDFTFKNKHNQPILIRAKTYPGKMVVLIYSSEEINVEKRKVPSTDSNAIILEEPL
ncbi:VanW family protein [Bacillus sp. ISL-35]|uniref:VanW family protein n=1 Tax=Bacillus sp. ISL-35 TaxID=2819122 RepID=UPI001BE61004|nr:VanW family protein [Bacillus sp. ISL-35]MBT2680986.1 VanW family protein [Bacillus sp. ISL-35]MBT2705305.1 VanW family protein [Chryseobacterium sp. ISL-80]